MQRPASLLSLLEGLQLFSDTFLNMPEFGHVKSVSLPDSGLECA